MRIFIVDDYPPFARSLQVLLGSQHQVEIATEAQGALDRLLTGEGFDLVLCDLSMTGLSGPDLHAALLERRPALLQRVAFMTGGVHTAEQREFLRRVSNPCLEKPFAREEVERLLLRQPAA